MQIGFYFDQSRCIGCDTCVIACKDWHDVSAGSSGWIRIVSNEKGKFPNPSLSYLFSTCMHCADPDCVPACPVGAIKKRPEDGIVVVDQKACLGNIACAMFCRDVCPYGVPQLGTENGAKMEKCDLCLDRWANDKKPVCVDACPMRALDAGPIDELKAKHGYIQEADGFTYSENTKPSILFKPKWKGDLIRGRGISPRCSEHCTQNKGIVV